DSALTLEAWESLFRAQVSIMRTLSAEFPTEEISLSDYDVLYTLSQAPGHRHRIKHLVDRMLLTQPSVSRLIDRLVARGLVTKTRDPGDGRGIIVELTEEGHAAFRRAAVEHSQSILRRVGGRLSDDELRQLVELTR